MINWTNLYEHFFMNGSINKEDAIIILREATQFFSKIKRQRA